MEFCLGLQLRSLAGQCLDRDWWNHATLLTLNTTQRWGLMTALGSSDSLSTISWNICLPEMYWIHNTYERPYLVFITYLIGKEVVLRNLSEWRNVSREWEVDKKIDLCCQSHALWFTLQGDSISLREKLPQAVKVICLLFSPTNLQESAGICRWLHPRGICVHNDVHPVIKRSRNKENDICSI